jgi:NADH-quinone oxidoreductase subunit G
VSRGPGEFALATWAELLDAGRMMHGAPALAGTARPARLRLSPATAARVGVVAGDDVSVTSRDASLTLPLETVADMPDGVVWVPTNSAAGGSLRERLAAAHGASVRVGKAAANSAQGGMQ